MFNLKKGKYFLLAAGAVLLHATAFPGFNLFFTAFFFLIPLLFILDRAESPRPFLLFFLFSLFSYLIILYWIPNVMVQYGGMSRSLSIFGLVALAAFLSIFSGLAGTAINRCLKYRYMFLLYVPLIWVIKDLVVEKIFGGFPWCLAGYSQYQNTLFIQLAELGGVHFITFLLVYFNMLIFLILKERNKKIVIVLTISLIWVFSTGYFLKRSAEHDLGAVPYHNAGIIQPNSIPEKYLDGRQTLAKLDELITDSIALAEQGAEFVVWPEYTVSIYPLQNDFYLKRLYRFTSRWVPLFAGFTDYRARGEIYNSMMLFKTEEYEQYDKVHLTPFGEYVLFRKLLFFVKRIVDEIGDFTPGQHIHNLEINGYKAATPICYEIIFPGLVRHFIAGGGQVIINISNDAWFGDTSAPRQHLSMAVLRSIENRRYTLRSTTNGISALITPTGEIVRQSPYNRKDQFIAPFQYLTEKTTFTRWGYLFPYFCLLSVLLALISRFFRKRKGQKSP